MFIDPIITSLLPILFIVLIFITYLNVVESKRTKSIDQKIGLITDYMKIVSDKLTEKSEKTTED